MINSNEKSVDVVVDGAVAKVPLICSECGEQFFLEVYMELTAYMFKKPKPVEELL